MTPLSGIATVRCPRTELLLADVTPTIAAPGSSVKPHEIAPSSVTLPPPANVNAPPVEDGSSPIFAGIVTVMPFASIMPPAAATVTVT